ncbi:MAG: hypothetical protein ACJAVM_001431 [Sulfitobacter sp.]|jgi:hypothetical protein
MTGFLTVSDYMLGVSSEIYFTQRLCNRLNGVFGSKSFARARELL